jgi:hypothetical protein
MPREYVEKRETGYYIVGSRVSLDTLVQAFLSGDSAETIQRAFSTLSLEEVYGASPSISVIAKKWKQRWVWTCANSKS